MEDQDSQEVPVKSAGKPTELTKKEKKKAENKFFKTIDKMDNGIISCLDYLVNVEDCWTDLETIKKSWGTVLDCLYIDPELSPACILIGECIECDKKAENETQEAQETPTPEIVVPTAKEYIESLTRMDKDVLIAASFLKNSGDDYFRYKEVLEAWDALMCSLHMEPDCSEAWQELNDLKDTDPPEEED